MLLSYFHALQTAASYQSATIFQQSSFITRQRKISHEPHVVILYTKINYPNKVQYCHDLCVTGYGPEDRGVGVRVPVGSRIFSSPSNPDGLWGPFNFLSNGYRGLFPWGKRPGREADHSPPASSDVKKMCIYTSTPSYAFMAQC
jgi:hypothetical protein